MDCRCYTELLLNRTSGGLDGPQRRAVSGMSVRLYLALPSDASGPAEFGSTNA